MMRFGEILKALRERAGFTQTGLADASGVPVGTIRDYEQGKRDPLLSTALKLAITLQQPLDVLAGRDADATARALGMARATDKADGKEKEKPTAKRKK